MKQEYFAIPPSEKSLFSKEILKTDLCRFASTVAAFGILSNCLLALVV